MEGVWQRTRSPDASSSEMFTHSHEHTHARLHKHTPALPRISCPELYDFPLSDYLRTRSERVSRGILKTSLLFFSFLAKGWTALTNVRPQRGRIGWQMRVKVASTKLCSKHGSLPSLPHVCVRLVLCVLSGTRADSWPGNPFQESQVEFCVKQRSIIGRARLTM